jgi:hypothetical protein
MLHNIFVRLKDEWEFEDSDSDSSSSSEHDDADEDGGREEVHDCSGADFQDAIRDRWLNANGWVDQDEDA